MLTTREAHRRRGLARAVLVDLLLQLTAPGRGGGGGCGGGEDEAHAAASGGGIPASGTGSSGHSGGGPMRPPFCYVVDSNVASRSLLASLMDEGELFTWQGWERPPPGVTT
jgi:hypothetical protein